MHSLQDKNHGSPCLFFEKERLAGVHFHERLLSESGMARVAIPQSQPNTKPRRGGTGVYFENSEVATTEGCLHPLHRQHASHGLVRTSTTMMPPVPCPVGQPLVAPPILATTLQLLDEQQLDQQEKSIDDGKHEPGRFSNMTVGHYLDPTRWPGNESGNEHGKDLFCETNRTAMREKLHSRDYRLSTDELTFVEAAVELSKGCGVQPTMFSNSQVHTTEMLSKPVLPHWVVPSSAKY